MTATPYYSEPGLSFESRCWNFSSLRLLRLNAQELKLISPSTYQRNQKDSVNIYRHSGIFSKLCMGVGDLILFALLIGCDYSPVSRSLCTIAVKLIVCIPQAGLPHCGMRTASGLVRYGLGTSLYAAAITYEGTELSSFLVKWRSRLRSQLAEDPKGYIGRAHPALARALPETFPDVNIVRLFTEPAVLEASHYDGLRVSRPMNIAKLGALCERYFAFGNRAGILRAFRTTLWSNEFTHMLISDALKNSGQEVQVIEHTISKPSILTVCFV